MALPITAQLNLGSDPVRARTWVLNELGPVLAKAGYTATASTAESVTFTRRFLPAWAAVLGILTLPLGILILALVRSTSVLVVDLGVQDGAVIATASGAGPRKVAELLAKLNREGVAMHPPAAPPQPTQRSGG
jgi:hypothetical protein